MKLNLISPVRSIILILVALSSVSIAQPDNRRPHSRDEGPPVARVTLFSQDNFRGESISLSAGERLDDFNHVRFPSGRNANNRVSSILIEGHAHVTIFDFRGFEGESITLLESASRLDRIPQERNGDWNNELSSIVVRSRPSDVAGEYGGSGGHSQIGGNHHDHNHRDGRSNDRPGYPRRDLGDDNWEKHIVLDRETVRVVERAYHDVLGRTPDAAGIQTYVRIISERGWSESRLRKELRRSSEYRTQVVPRTVRSAYLEVLGREADPAGLRFYTSRMINSEWTESRIREALKKSPEFANRSRVTTSPTTPRINQPARPKYIPAKSVRPKTTLVVKEKPHSNQPIVVTPPDRPKTTLVVNKPDRQKTTTPAPEPVPEKEQKLLIERPPPKLR